MPRIPSIPPRALPLLDRLEGLLSSRGVTTYIVGGFLRDALLGLDPHDVDLAVDGDGLGVARELARSLNGALVILDDRRLVGRVVVKGEGSGWTVDVAALRRDIRHDLSLRDFTIDALALPLAGYREAWPFGLLDPYGGREDLRKRRVRGLRPEVFDDDPARLLRAPRVAARLGFRIERGTQAAIAARHGLLRRVAGERVRDEFFGLLSQERGAEWLPALDRLHLLTQVVPGLEEARGVTQPREHYYTVLEHMVACAAAAEDITSNTRDGPATVVPWDDAIAAHFAEEATDGFDRRMLLKFSALVHDIAKPRTKAPDATGRIRFFGHQTQGAEMAGEACERLRLSRHATEMVMLMVEHHLRPVQLAQDGESPTPRAIFRYFRDLGEAAIDTLYLALADYLAAKGPNLDMDEWERHVRIIRHILEAGLKQEPPREKAWLVDGHDLMASLGMGPGPALGEVLDSVHEAQAVGEVETREQALAWARVYIARTGEGVASEDS